jgi:hypothetical protein
MKAFRTVTLIVIKRCAVKFPVKASRTIILQPSSLPLHVIRHHFTKSFRTMFWMNNKIINLNISADHNFVPVKIQLRQYKYHSQIPPVVCNYWNHFFEMELHIFKRKRLDTESV